MNHMRPIYKRLIYRLYPESIATWRDRVVKILKEPHTGTMTVNKVSKLSVVPDCAVADIFDELRRTKKWKSVKSGIGEMGIAQRLDHDNKDAGPFIRKNKLIIAISCFVGFAWLVLFTVLRSWLIKPTFKSWTEVFVHIMLSICSFLVTGFIALKNYKQKINE